MCILDAIFVPVLNVQKRWKSTIKFLICLRLSTKPEVLKLLTGPSLLSNMICFVRKVLGVAEEWCLISINAVEVLALILQAQPL